MTAMIDIAALDDIPRQGARVVKTPAGCIAVFFAGYAGALYAFISMQRFLI